MFGGFRERAQHTYELLKTPGTAFVVVAAPEPDALREASYFVERLSAERMPLAGLVVNRVHRTDRWPKACLHCPPPGPRRAPTPWRPRPAASGALAEAALRVHAEIAAAAEHDARMAKRFSAAHREFRGPGAGAVRPTCTTWTGCAPIGGPARHRH